MSTYKIQPVQVDPKNPFANDLLEREKEIEILTPLILNLNSPAVFAVNSRWGTGKTTFVDMWSAYLRSNEIPTLKFNAWATDFSSDPLIAFLGEMNDQLGEFIGEEGEKRERWEKAKKLSKKIIKLSLPALLKLLTSGMINADEFVKTGAAELLGSLAEDALKSYTNQKNAIDEFKNSLYETFKDENNRPIVIFVDELDRCRPDYAINLLERIKHLFDIDGLIFILALDREQLSHSVRSVYGEGMDADGYLRRFIDFEYTLKEPQIDQYIIFLQKSLSIDTFITKHPKKLPGFEDELLNMQYTFYQLSIAYSLTLREIEQIYSKINLAIRATKEYEYINSILLTALLVPKEKDIELYNNYINPLNNEIEIINQLQNKINSKQRKPIIASIEAFLIISKLPLRDGMDKSEMIKKYDVMRANEKVSEDDREHADFVINQTRALSFFRKQISLESIINRIELASEIKLVGSEENTEDES